MDLKNNSTKIIVTYGPALDKSADLYEVLRKVDIVRINMSHGNSEQWLYFLKKISDFNLKSHKKVEILGDLPGPKIRVHGVKSDMRISKNDRIVLSYQNQQDGGLYINFDIYDFLNIGSALYIGDDGLKFVVDNLNNRKISCVALTEGIIVEGRGVDIESMPDSFAPPTHADIEGIKFALDNNFDYIAVSFVASAADIAVVREHSKDLKVISKIERSCAIERIESIVNASDCVMVARGDLGFAIPIESVPIAQKNIIKVCERMKKQVIVATQMLASMVESTMPTRAEVSDVVNAVIDGADYLMLSNETAVGKHPLEAVIVLRNGIHYAQQYMNMNK